VHKCYFEKEVLELERLIFEKKKEDNPFYNMNLSQDLSQKISYSRAFLSETLKTNQGNLNFKNFIDMIYVFLFSTSGGILYSLNTKGTSEKVVEIEEYIMKNYENSNKNVYSIFNDCYENLTKYKDIYNTLKYLNENNKKIFEIKGLPEEFNNFVNFICTLQEYINKGQNMETMIDLEILSHKLSKIKTYSDM
jgi:hypothetical protein